MSLESKFEIWKKKKKKKMSLFRGNILTGGRCENEDFCEKCKKALIWLQLFSFALFLHVWNILNLFWWFKRYTFFYKQLGSDLKP